MIVHNLLAQLLFFLTAVYSHPSPQEGPSLVALQSQFPSATSQLTESTAFSNGTLPNYFVSCNRPTRFGDRRISVPSCLSAIAHFLSSRRTATFHNLPPDDDYLLPEMHEGVDCVVTVDMFGRRTQERESWFGVKNAARAVVLECPVENQAGWTWGGTVRVGATEGILITVSKKRQVL